MSEKITANDPTHSEFFQLRAEPMTERVEGDSITFVTGGGKVKSSARRALKKSDILYLSSLDADGFTAREQFEAWRSSLTIELDFNGLPVFTREDLPQFISRIYQWKKVTKPVAASFASPS